MGWKEKENKLMGELLMTEETTGQKRGHGCLKNETHLNKKERWLQRSKVIAGKKKRFLEGKTVDRV